METLFTGPSLGRGLFLCSYQCVGGGAAGASPTRLELPYGRAGFPIRWGLLTGYGLGLPHHTGSGVVWSLSHQPRSCPSPVLISSLPHTGIPSGAQHQPLRVGRSTTNASLDNAPRFTLSSSHPSLRPKL